MVNSLLWNTSWEKPEALQFSRGPRHRRLYALDEHEFTIRALVILLGLISLNL